MCLESQLVCLINLFYEEFGKTEISKNLIIQAHSACLGRSGHWSSFKLNRTEWNQNIKNMLVDRTYFPATNLNILSAESLKL